MVADADVVDHEALVLGLPGDAVDPRDGLQQVVGDDHLVEIHHLLDRRIEAREQHVVDDEHPRVPAHPFVFSTEGQLEALDARLVPRRVRMGLQVQRIVVASGDDHGRAQRPEPFQARASGVGPFQLRGGGSERRVEVRLVTHGRFARRGDHLRLVAVRVHVGQVVVDHVPRLRLDGRFRFQVGVP